jgi:hypothetical protein
LEEDYDSDPYEQPQKRPRLITKQSNNNDSDSSKDIYPLRKGGQPRPGLNLNDSDSDFQDRVQQRIIRNGRSLDNPHNRNRKPLNDNDSDFIRKQSNRAGNQIPISDYSDDIPQQKFSRFQGNSKPLFGFPQGIDGNENVRFPRVSNKQTGLRQRPAPVLGQNEPRLFGRESRRFEGSDDDDDLRSVPKKVDWGFPLALIPQPDDVPQIIDDLLEKYSVTKMLGHLKRSED